MHVSSKIYQVRNITDRERLITCEEPITTIRTSVCESLQIPIIIMNFKAGDSLSDVSGYYQQDRGCLMQLAICL